MISPIQVLDYAPQLGRRPGWVYAILTVYALLLLALAAFPFAMVFFDWGADAFWPAAIFDCALFVVGAALLFIPVRAKLHRPIRRRSLWIPISGASLMLAFLFVCIGFAAADAFNADVFVNSALWGAAAVWLLWLFLFWFASRSLDPLSASARIYKYVLAGCLLELLVAVPMHIIARRRTECCAGIASGVSIGLGVAVAIIAFGPAIFFLFYKRWRRYYAPQPSRYGTSPSSRPPHDLS